MKLLHWLNCHWGNLLLTALAVAIFYLLFTKDDVVTPAATKKPLTEKQKAWKHWQQYWSFYEPYKDAWSHEDPSGYIYYIRDKTTGLCFAVATPFGPSGFMASVPCDKVQDQLQQR